MSGQNCEKMVKMIRQLIVDYYKGHPEMLDLTIAVPLKDLCGYFRFGQDILCYGQTVASTSPTVNGHLSNAPEHVCSHAGTIILPFDPAQTVNNLRYERYVDQSGQRTWLESDWIKKLYYRLRPLFPISLRKYLQKAYLRGWETIPFPTWPVDHSVDRLCEKLLGLTMQTLDIDRVPFIWFWPEGYAACAIVTHDVEGPTGHDFTGALMDIDDAYGIKASFQIVPEKRYIVSPEYLEAIRQRGFEINVQGLTHDGRLFWNWEEFRRRAQKINQYAKEWGAQGFRSPVLYRNVDWMKHLIII